MMEIYITENELKVIKQVIKGSDETKTWISADVTSGNVKNMIVQYIKESKKYLEIKNKLQ